MDEINPTSATAINITLDLLPLGVGLVLLPLTIAAGVAALRKTPPTLSRDLLHRFGIGALPSGLVTALGLLWLVLFTTFILGILWVIVTLLWTGPAVTADDAPDYRWHLLTLTALTASLAAVVALPFTLLRTGYAARQTRTAEENLTTDLINKAVEGLGAEKTLSRMGRALRYQYASDDFVATVQRLEWHDEPFAAERDDIIAEPEYGPWTAFEETKPNIEVRLGAIYALERIAQESPRDHIRVMEILCAYLRENAPARDARRHDLGPWPELPVFPDQDDFAKHFEEVEKWTLRLKNWLEKLRADYPPRADIQAAITVIGRRSPAQIVLEQRRKDKGTSTFHLDLRKVNLQAADLSGLNLTYAQMDGARLDGAFCDGTQFGGVGLAMAHLEGARLILTNLERAHLEGSHLESATIVLANLEGVMIEDLHISTGTVFRPMKLRGAGLKNVNLSTAITADDALPRLLSEAFGDATVILPDGLKAGDAPLDHWSTENLNWPDFRNAWHAHQRTIGYVPPD